MYFEMVMFVVFMVLFVHHFYLKNLCLILCEIWNRQYFRKRFKSFRCKSLNLDLIRNVDLFPNGFFYYSLKLAALSMQSYISIKTTIIFFISCHYSILVEWHSTNYAAVTYCTQFIIPHVFPIQISYFRIFILSFC